MAEIKLSSFGSKDGAKTYNTINEWDCFCQGGGNGIVFGKEKNYTTAFFEAFPKNPSCFIRGEGETVKDAEIDAWNKYQKILVCDHEMERRDRTDGYGYCKHCSYSSTVFEPLTKCCKCKVPTAYTSDYKGRYYCEKHARIKPRNPKPDRWDSLLENRRLPRKTKKLMKFGASVKIYGHKYGKIKANFKFRPKFTGNGYRVAPLFKNQDRELIRLGKSRKEAQQ